jgi:NADH-quinone oxidoreductase subunit C
MNIATCPFPAIAITATDYAKCGSTAYCYVEPRNVVRAAKYFFEAGYFIEDVCGLDLEEGFEVVYHFDSFTAPGRVSLRLVVPHDKPVVPSIAGVFPGAEWHERETTDFFGVVFEGNPNPKPLLLPDDMTLHPLVKEQKKRQPAVNVFVVHRLSEGKEPTAAKKKPADEDEEA